MELVIAFLAGFVIAAIGIVAPGMLNMTIARLSVEESKKQALLFALGSVVIVFFQSFVGTYFAKFLDTNPHVTEMLKKFGTVIFILLTFFFIYNGIKAKKKENINVEVKDKRNRFLFGVTLSSLNMFAVPYYAVMGLMLASKDLFHFSILEIISFSLAASIGTFAIFYIYAVFFKKIEHKVTLLSKNINFFIAIVTGIVAITSLVKILS
ncbi:LysE family translocator [Flavobacterium sp. NRK F10]|uniref:LysE family transporter n=1 Tax=Flavobacterium sp. NRK F10 TaxID=2954931 RepID=UPI002090AD18|nr:LysE family transporter [Flavobacterium sp. NRK F10]MCO6175023.1 LysE family translocator [Flavobacterium sp. NRK F10]